MDFSTSLQSQTSESLGKIWENNAAVPHMVHDLVHNLIDIIIARHPQRPAVCAWDGNVTYREFDELAERIACDLTILGIGPGDIVPLCFEKSLWTAVALLGVLRSGASFVLLDPSLPERRLQDIVEQTSARRILSSDRSCDLASRLLLTTPIIVGPSLRDDHGDETRHAVEHRVPDSSSNAYVVFTSGSTGTPKGCQVSHENICSALQHQIPSFGYGPDSRVFDFAAYSFDVSVYNALSTFCSGGCLCVPSELDRKENLAHAMVCMRSTLVHLTPSVSRILDDSEIPTLETLILSGEMVREHDINSWWGRVPHLIQGYGPAECTPYSVMNTQSSTPIMLNSIGFAKGAVVWVVDADDHQVLMPWGEPGELMLEGPIVGRGYLNDPEKTAASFVTDPEWLLEGTIGFNGRRGRLYKTGDLGRYDENGKIVILGRKDTQVKIRGNRVELGEVECRVQDCIPNCLNVAAEVIQPPGSRNPILAAFLCLRDSPSAARPQRISMSEDAMAKLSELLPAYMIPTVFFSLPKLPSTPSGKVDRKELRDVGNSQSLEQIVLTSSGGKQRPRSDAERNLCNLWAKVLDFDANSIGMDDRFFRLGADSISAMRLVVAARRAGIRLSITDVFRNLTLHELSQLIVPIPKDLPPMDGHVGVTLVNPVYRDELISHVLSTMKMESFGDTEILPLTDMQEYFLRDGISENRLYVDYNYIDLGSRLDVDRMRESCREVIELFPIMRATFVQYEGRHWAVIPSYIDLPFQLIDVDLDLPDALSAFCRSDIASFGRIQTIALFTLLRHKETGFRLIIRLSHAQYDGVCLEVIYKSLFDSYRGRKVARQPLTFSDYMKHVRRQRTASISHFNEILSEARYTDISTYFLPKEMPLKAVPYHIEQEITSPKVQSDLTLASLLSAAWGFFLARLLDCDEIVYGNMVNGRNAALPGIEEVVGCCINVVPIRISLSSSHMLIRSIAEEVQNQYGRLGEADTLGFDEAVQNCTQWPEATKIFTATLHQNVDHNLAFEIEDGVIVYPEKFNNYCKVPFFLYMITWPRGDKLGIEFFSHSQMMAPDTAKELLARFGRVVERFVLATEENLSIGDLSIEI
nr:nonribosomal peptide synthetase dtxs1 [Quercus suber]